MENSPSIAEGRTKRQKIDKTGRFAALQKLKNLKGSKNKCEIGEIEKVYDEIDEKQYAKTVLARQEDDWIEDDDGSGYVEDGREIFDDDLDEETIVQSSKRSKGTKRKAGKSSGSIKTMLANMPVKKKNVVPIKAEDDNILADLMEEMNNDKKVELSSKEYLQSLAHTVKTPKPKVNPVLRTPILPKQNLVTSNLNKRRTQITDEDLEEFGLTVIPESCNKPMEDLEPMQETIDDKDHLLSSLTDHPTLNLDDDINIDDFNDGDFDVNDADLTTDEPTVKTPITSKHSVLKGTSRPVNEETWTSCGNIDLFKDNVKVDTSTLPLTTDENGEQVFRFYWLDAYEDGFKQPGIVYLFGKVYVESAKQYLSCCVSVKNIDRRIFILPRERRFDLKNNIETEQPVTISDVYKEFNEKIANPNKLMNFKSRKVTRRYAFDMQDVPAESDYLEVKYPATNIKLSNDLQGETFSRIFGTNTSSLELLLLERKIKGPCWLELKQLQPSTVASSWCKVEAICQKPEDVTISSRADPPPPLVIVTLNIRTTIVPKTMQNEIIMIGCLIHNEFRVDKPAPNPGYKSHFCAFTKPSGIPWPIDFKKLINGYNATQVFQHESERSLLAFFLAKLFIIDPDLIIGHDLYGFTLDTLLHRIDLHKVPHWSRLGRIKRAIIPQTKGKFSDKNIVCGRLVCDLNISARELIRARSYDLDCLCKQILQIKEDGRHDYTNEEIKEMFGKSPSIFNLVGATMRDATFILRLMYEMNVVPLAMQITNIAGNVLSRTLLGGRSERNEFLLLHAFTENNFIVPDKTYNKRKAIIDEDDGQPASSKRKPQYAGGLVLEPKKGFYDKMILLMDFNSLYPSIIQEYNICFTTVTRTDDDDVEPEVPSPGLPLGILPIEIRKLVVCRREVKSLMKDSKLTSEQRMQYNIRQLALKLTANSMYGCLGFSFSRFYAKPLAALVTSKGREILMNTRDIVQKMNYDVIYGDTDSIMINTNCLDYDHVFKIGSKIKQEINKLYKNIELEVDGVFKYMLLLKKKKYAAVSLSKNAQGELISTQEHKGLDIVRRDWSQLSAEVGRFVLNQILSDLGPDERLANIREHLEKVAADMKNRVVPISLLAITKQLAKNPEEYADKKSLPHLQVAIRVNSKGGKKLKAGDSVPYVICDDGSNLPAAQRAYHIDELKVNENLIIDVNYYLSQQIHPVVSRLCEPIEGADPAFIADCLGLDASNYKKLQCNPSEQQGDDEGDYTLINDLESFKNCDKFSFHCMNDACKTKIFIDGPLYDNAPVLGKCRNPSCVTKPVEYLASIQNTLQMTIRSYIQRFYQNWMICEDPACPNRTRRIPLMFINSFPVCTMCKKGLMYREYRNSDLYYQLKYFEYMFNTRTVKIPLSPQLQSGYTLLHTQISEILNRSAYRILDFSKIFKFSMKVEHGKNKVNTKQRAIIDSQKKWQVM